MTPSLLFAAILKVYLAAMRTRGRLDMDALAEATAGYSGAELTAVCREAGPQAIGRRPERRMAPHQVFVCRQDVNRALTALKSRRFRREAISEHKTPPENTVIFRGRVNQIVRGSSPIR